MLDLKMMDLGGLRVRVLTPDSQGPNPPAILLCHGFGAPGNDLVGLADYLKVPPGTRWFFPEAPIDLSFEGIPGRAWWRIDLMRLQMTAMTGRTRELIQETPAGLDQARTKLEACIAEMVASHGVSRDRLIIGGFSQGAMLATDVALASPETFAGLAILSGTIVSEPVWKAELVAAGPRLQVLMSHGRNDPLLPFAIAESLKDLLIGAGAKVDWVPHPGQHEIPPEVLARLSAFALRRLGSSSSQ